MATRDWIKKVVDTRGKLCPRLDRTCEESKCGFWITEPIGDGTDLDVVSGCLDGFKYVMDNQMLLELTRYQATIAQLTNADSVVARAIVDGAARALPRRPHAGQLEGA